MIDGISGGSAKLIPTSTSQVMGGGHKNNCQQDIQVVCRFDGFPSFDPISFNTNVYKNSNGKNDH
jgi:hypothetical protein